VRSSGADDDDADETQISNAALHSMFQDLHSVNPFGESFEWRKCVAPEYKMRSVREEFSLVERVVRPMRSALPPCTPPPLADCSQPCLSLTDCADLPR
jgi:hypothetical protein